MARTWTRWLVGLVAAGVLAGCGDDDAPPATPTPPAGKAQVRVVHAAADAPAVDVYAEGVAAPLLTNVAYGDASAYVTVDAGTYNLQVRPAGAAASSAPVYSTGPLALAADAKVTAVAAGLLGATSTEQAFRVVPLAERFGAAADGQARVRVVHAGADAPAVALDVGADGSPEVQGLARFADTGEAGVALPAGQPLRVAIWAGSPLARVTSFSLPALPSRGELFVVATGLLSRLPRESDGFALVAAAGSGGLGRIKQEPTVYALHAGPDAPAVDLFSGATEVEGGLAFGELSGALQVPVGPLTVDVFPAAAGTARPAGRPAVSLTATLEAGERYLVVATGFLSPGAGQPALQLRPYVDGFARDAGQVRVRAVHASPDAPTVDVGPLTGGNVPTAAAFDDLSFPDASAAAGLSLPASNLTVGVAPAAASNRTPVATFALPLSALADQRVFAVAAGALDTSGGRAGFRLLAVNTAASPWSVTALTPQ